ncbi:MAG: hypothetical protein ACXAEU_21045 [Candidatus Hodarchaeales archaeon]|jgi:hypothetical protein
MTKNNWCFLFEVVGQEVYNRVPAVKVHYLVTEKGEYRYSYCFALKSTKGIQEKLWISNTWIDIATELFWHASELVSSLSGSIDFKNIQSINAKIGESGFVAGFDNHTIAGVPDDFEKVLISESETKDTPKEVKPKKSKPKAKQKVSEKKFGSTIGEIIQAKKEGRI